MFFFVVLTLVFSSCQWNSDSWGTGESALENEKIHRYDRLVDEFVSLNSFTALQRMNTEYPRATRLLIEDVLAIGSVQDELIEQRLREFYLDSTMQALIEDVHKEYADLRGEEKEIFSVFNRIKKADPEFRVPLVYVQVSGLNQSIVVGDSVLGISLDKYLGSDYPLYKKYYYSYQRRPMDRSRLVPDALFYYLTHEYPLPDNKVHTLLDYIVNFGKFHWIIAKCRNMPLVQEAGLDDERIGWYRKNEGEVWERLNETHMLYSADMTMVKRFMRPRANTPYISDDAPDQIGLWIGLQIVEHYMKKHPDLTIGELLRMTDYKKLLLDSGYNPSA